MKYFLLVTIAMGFSLKSYTQITEKQTEVTPESYSITMQKNIKDLSVAKYKEDYQKIYESLDSISRVYPNEWAPTYYKALIKTVQTFRAKDKTAAAAELALFSAGLEGLLEKPTLEKQNEVKSEIHALIAMMYTARMWSNTRELGPKFAPLQAKHLQQAIALNSNNPRAHMLTAQNLFYTPEAFGGDKKKAKTLAEKALQLFKEEKARDHANELLPTWGVDQVQGMLRQFK